MSEDFRHQVYETLQAFSDSCGGMTYEDAVSAIDLLYDPVRARAEAAERRVAELEEALRPFAKAGALFPDDDPCVVAGYETSIYAPAAGPEFSIASGDLRNAARLVGEEG